VLRLRWVSENCLRINGDGKSCCGTVPSHTVRGGVNVARLPHVIMGNVIQLVWGHGPLAMDTSVQNRMRGLA